MHLWQSATTFGKNLLKSGRRLLTNVFFFGEHSTRFVLCITRKWNVRESERESEKFSHGIFLSVCFPSNNNDIRVIFFRLHPSFTAVHNAVVSSSLITLFAYQNISCSLPNEWTANEKNYSVTSINKNLKVHIREQWKSLSALRFFLFD